jgi:hypothetical protein
VIAGRDFCAANDEARAPSKEVNDVLRIRESKSIPSGMSLPHLTRHRRCGCAIHCSAPQGRKSHLVAVGRIHAGTGLTIFGDIVTACGRRSVSRTPCRTFAPASSGTSYGTGKERSAIRKARAMIRKTSCMSMSLNPVVRGGRTSSERYPEASFMLRGWMKMAWSRDWLQRLGKLLKEQPGPAMNELCQEPTGWEPEEIFEELLSFARRL